MLDYYAWRKKPRTGHYTSYLLKQQLDASDLSQEETPPPTPQRLTSPKPETSNVGTLLAAPITQPGSFFEILLKCGFGDFKIFYLM